MKKGQLRKELRLGIIIGCILVIGSLAIFSYDKYKNPNLYEKKVSLYSYSSQGKVNYEVSLKPNSLYDQKSLGEDQVYLSNLVDSIDATYSYEFAGEREAEIKGKYEILAVIEGYSGEGDKLTTLWKKQIPLVPKEDFGAKDKKLSLTKKIPLKPKDFNDIAQKINDETKINTQTKVTAIMNVELNAKTDKGIIEKKSTSSIEIPLAGSYFKITKTQNENKPEALEEVKKVQRPIDKKQLMFYETGLGIVIVGIIILLFGTQSVEIDPVVKELKKVFKKNGTRLVALDSEIAAASELQSQVRSMEDLVRISDELGKPIIYKYSDDYKENSKFWVIDEERFYVFEVKTTESKGYSLKDRVKGNRTQENGSSEEVVSRGDKQVNHEDV